MTQEQQPGIEPPSIEPQGIEPPVIEPQGIEPPPMPEPAAKPSGLKRVGAIGVVVAGALGVIVWKFVLPIVLVGVAGGVFGSAFGGPYNRLPSDVRNGFEDRFKTAVGPTFEQQSDEDQKARVVSLVTNGLPRLSDAQVETNFRLSVKGMQAVDTASCTAIAKAFFSGTEPPDSAFTSLVGTLTDAELQQWFEIRLLAIEAETRQPGARVDQRCDHRSAVRAAGRRDEPGRRRHAREHVERRDDRGRADVPGAPGPVRLRPDAGAR
jgi:hypothetical protein